jgi:hypothetical protein
VRRIIFVPQEYPPPILIILLFLNVASWSREEGVLEARKAGFGRGERMKGTKSKVSTKMLVIFCKKLKFYMRKNIRILLENRVFRDHHKLQQFCATVPLLHIFVNSLLLYIFSFMVTICRNYIFSLNLWHS